STAMPVRKRFSTRCLPCRRTPVAIVPRTEADCAWTLFGPDRAEHCIPLPPALSRLARSQRDRVRRVLIRRPHAEVTSFAADLPAPLAIVPGSRATLT